MQRITASVLLLLLFVWVDISSPDVSSQENDNPVALIMSTSRDIQSHDVWLVDAITGEQTYITRLYGVHSVASWSPTGRYVTLSNNQDTDSRSLRIYDTVSNDIIPITYRIRDTPACGGNFWSPDERFIAYQTTTGLILNELVDGSLGEPTQLTESVPSPFTQLLNWSSDGNYLLFRDPPDNYGLIDLTLDLAHGDILAELGITGLRSARFSPDGRYLLIQFMDETPAGNYALIELSTLQVNYFITDARFVWWSPDSQYVSFRQDNRQQPQDLYFLRVADAQFYEVPVREDTRPVSNNMWGRGVYITTGVDGDWVEIATADGDVQAVVQQSDIGRYIHHFWSPDRTMLGIRTNINGETDHITHIHIYDVSAMTDVRLVQTIEVTTLADIAGFLVWSEDEQYLSIVGIDKIVLVDLQTGDTVILPEDPNFVGTFPQNWVGDIFVLERYSGRENALFLYDMDARAVLPLVNSQDREDRFRGWQGQWELTGFVRGACGSG